MKNMKILLKLLSGFTLTTVAANSVVACESPSPEVKVTDMNIQVKKDFGFLDNDAKTLINLNIYTNTTTKIATWKSDQLVGITADKLLETGGTSAKAKSSDAANFLVDVLKLEVESGKGQGRIFKHNNATLISLKVKTYSPIITKNSDNNDYVITGGTVTVCFENNSKQISDDYSLNILNTTTPLVFNNLPSRNFSNANFKTIPGFAVGQPKSAFQVGTDLTSYLKTDSGEGKTLKNIVDLIKQGDLKIKVSTGATGAEETFVQGNIIKVKISIGEIEFNYEYTLTVPVNL